MTKENEMHPAVEALRNRAHKAQFSQPEGEFYLSSSPRFLRAERGALPSSVNPNVECLSVANFGHGSEGRTEYYLMRYQDHYYCIHAKPYVELRANKKAIYREENGDYFWHRAWFDVKFSSSFSGDFNCPDEIRNLPVTPHKIHMIEDPVVTASFQLLSHATGMYRDDERIVRIGVHESEPIAIKNWRVNANA